MTGFRSNHACSKLPSLTNYFVGLSKPGVTSLQNKRDTPVILSAIILPNYSKYWIVFAMQDLGLFMSFCLLVRLEQWKLTMWLVSYVSFMTCKKVTCSVAALARTRHKFNAIVARVMLIYERLERPDVKCKYLYVVPMHFIAQSKHEKTRQNWSKHCVDNAFNYVTFADPERNIFGATSVETPHALRNGLVEVVTYVVLENVPAQKSGLWITSHYDFTAHIAKHVEMHFRRPSSAVASQI